DRHGVGKRTGIDLISYPSSTPRGALGPLPDVSEGKATIHSFGQRLDRAPKIIDSGPDASGDLVERSSVEVVGSDTVLPDEQSDIVGVDGRERVSERKHGAGPGTFLMGIVSTPDHPVLVAPFDTGQGFGTRHEAGPHITVGGEILRGRLGQHPAQ